MEAGSNLKIAGTSGGKIRRSICCHFCFQRTEEPDILCGQDWIAAVYSVLFPVHECMLVAQCFPLILTCAVCADSKTRSLANGVSRYTFELAWRLFKDILPCDVDSVYVSMVDECAALISFQKCRCSCSVLFAFELFLTRRRRIPRQFLLCKLRMPSECFG